MKKFILCDLHIGHEDAKRDVIAEAINYVRSEAKECDDQGIGDR